MPYLAGLAPSYKAFVILMSCLIAAPGIARAGHLQAP